MQITIWRVKLICGRLNAVGETTSGLLNKFFPSPSQKLNSHLKQKRYTVTKGGVENFSMQGERRSMDQAAWQTGMWSLNTLGNVCRKEEVSPKVKEQDWRKK